LLRKPLITLLLVALLPLVACSSSSGGGASPAGAADEVSITVENRINPRVELTVRLITPSAQRLVLGSVRPGGTSTLSYRGTLERTEYRIEAESSRGNQLTSQPFVLFPGARVVWSLPQNSVAVYPPEGGDAEQ
jgi:hypothetical protein